MRTYITLCITFAALLGITTEARAEHRPALFELARQYEASAEQFEQVVLSVRGIDRSDEQLVDRLDDAAARFRRAAQNPRHLNRLYFEWQKIQKLQAEVESNIFGKYTPHHDLFYTWRVVQQRNLIFAEEFFYHVENPDHAQGVRRVMETSARRDRYFGSTPR